MADTSSKTMDPKNVAWPDSRHAALAMWSSIKGDLEKLLGPKIDGELGKIRTSDADKLVKEALARKDAVKDTYFKIGLIGTDLVLRVKAKEGGVKQILGYDQKDALLLRGCKIKTASASKASAELTFKTVFVLTPGDCKPVFNEYLDIGRGFGLELSVTVKGADKNPGLAERVAKLHKDFCAEYSKAARAIADDAASRLSKLTVKNAKTLEDVASDAQAELEKLLDDTAVSRAFERRVSDMVATDSNLKQHATEWQIKGACKAVITTIKLTAAIVRLAASHGADVTAYKSVVECGLKFYSLIKDFLKTELEVAGELDKAIDLYARSANDLLAEIQALYKEGQLAATTKLQKIKAGAATAGSAATLIQDKVTAAIKKLTGKDVGQAPEAARRRYLVELGKLLGKLDEQFTKLADAMAKFAKSSIRDAVAAWPALQRLKTACESALKHLRERQTYAEAAKTKIAALGIEVSDSTDLDKLKTMVEGIRSFDKSKVIGGTTTVASIASTVHSAYEAVSGLVGAVSAFA